MSMRVLGIDIQAAEVVAVLLDGDHKEAVIEKLEPPRLPLPQAGNDEADNLVLFQNQLTAIISQTKAECISIVKATMGMYSASPIKVKIECLVQLAAKRNNVRCELLTSQKVARAEKTTVEGGESLKRAIADLSPQYARKAAYCAWSVLHDHA